MYTCTSCLSVNCCITNVYHPCLHSDFVTSNMMLARLIMKLLRQVRYITYLCYCLHYHLIHTCTLKKLNAEETVALSNCWRYRTICHQQDPEYECSNKLPLDFKCFFSCGSCVLKIKCYFVFWEDFTVLIILVFHQCFSLYMQIHAWEQWPVYA